MKVFVIENNTVTNIITINDNDNPADWGAVQLTSHVDFTAIGDTIIDGVSVEGAIREEQHNDSIQVIIENPPQ